MTEASICLACGYDLRGLPLDGLCPECATPVRASHSAAGGALHAAPPSWLLSLSWGVRLLLAAPLAFFIVPNFTGFFLRGASFDTVALVAAIIPTCVVIMFSAGVWLVTHPHPAFHASGAAWRWALRLVALLPLVQAITCFVPFRSGRWILTHPLTLTLATLPLPALLLLHLRRLALRLPSPRLARHCTIVAAGLTLSLVVAIIDEAAGLTPKAGLEITAAVFAMVFGVWGLVVLLCLVIAFRRAHRQSVATWGDWVLVQHLATR